MGGSDRYCAICASSLEIVPLEIGSNSERAKKIRKHFVDYGLRKRSGQNSGDNEDDLHRSDSESDLSESEQRFDIQRKYDPEIMKSRDTTLENRDRFIGHVRLVICDPDIKSSSKYFISGPAKADDFGWGTVNGGHPERPDEEFENVLYMEYEDDQTKAFPGHGLCLQILAKVILGEPDSKSLNPEVLYKAMCDVHHGDDPTLYLNYGDVCCQGQYWECVPGEEYGVMNPLEFYDLHMQTIVNLTVEESSLGPHNTIADPFQRLSNELIHLIANYLGNDDVFSLRQASMIVRDATTIDSFWTSRAQKTFAWLWIPRTLFKAKTTDSRGIADPPIDWMKVLLLFNKATAHPWGKKSVYMGLANRRRIWTACEDLRAEYMSQAAKSGLSVTNPNPERQTWALDSEIDTLWSEALERLESKEEWLKCQKRKPR